MKYRFICLLVLLLLASCAEEQTVDAPVAPTTVPLNGAAATPIPTEAEAEPNATAESESAELPTEAAPAPTAEPVPTAASAEPTGATLPSSNEVVPPIDTVNLPPGFGISVYQAQLRGPRMMTVGPDNQIYVAERAAGRIVRLPDADQNGLSDEIVVVVDNLDSPSSLAFDADGNMFVAETTRVLRFPTNNDGTFSDPITIIDGLPSGGHSTRTLLFSPDYQTLYVSVGSSCNVCDEDDPRRAAIVAYNPDGMNERIYTEGLRNGVGIDLRPGTAEIWATNNGRDMLGDDQPPENIYQIDQADLDAGWPRCHSGRIIDPEFGSENACEGVLQPVVEMQAHSAPLGLEWSQGVQTNFPAPYNNGLFVAFHGSWNRTVPTGYKVVFIPFDQATPGAVQDFATGWLKDDGTVWGRPVDVLFGPDGALYVSDDSGGIVYRIFAQ